MRTYSNRSKDGQVTDLRTGFMENSEVRVINPAGSNVEGLDRSVKKRITENMMHILYFEGGRKSTSGGNRLSPTSSSFVIATKHQRHLETN